MNQEHAASTQRRMAVGFTLAGAAAAALALTATSPAAHADDTVVLPDFPVYTGASNVEGLGLVPLWDGVAFDSQGTYTDLLGDSITTIGSPFGLGRQRVGRGSG